MRFIYSYLDNTNIRLLKVLILITTISTITAFAMAQTYYHDLTLRKRAVPNGKGFGMYATQYITGRHRKLHMYPDEVVSYKKGYREVFNIKQINARKVWNNQVQGLGGWMSIDAALRYYREYSWQGMKLFAQIHDALDGQIRTDSLWRVGKLMEYMVDYPLEFEGRNLLLVDLDAGMNWQPASEINPQGMKPVFDVDLWIDSQGVKGYE